MSSPSAARSSFEVADRVVGREVRKAAALVAYAARRRRTGSRTRARRARRRRRARSRVGSTSSCRPCSSTGSLWPVPRGSKPTMSNRSRSSSGKRVGRARHVVDARTTGTTRVHYERADPLRLVARGKADHREVHLCAGRVRVVERHAERRALEGAAARPPPQAAAVVVPVCAPATPSSSSAAITKTIATTATTRRIRTRSGYGSSPSPFGSARVGRRAARA